MNSIGDFTQTLTHHPIWKLNDSVSSIDDHIFDWVMMNQTPKYKQKLISTLSRDQWVQELYTMIQSRSGQYSVSQLAHCLNAASEEMMNNMKTDEWRKDVYLEVLSKKTSINKELLRYYYKTYHKVMSDWYLNYSNMLDEAFERFETSIAELRI